MRIKCNSSNKAHIKEGNRNRCDLRCKLANSRMITSQDGGEAGSGFSRTPVVFLFWNIFESFFFFSFFSFAKNSKARDVLSRRRTSLLSDSFGNVSRRKVCKMCSSDGQIQQVGYRVKCQMREKVKKVSKHTLQVALSTSLPQMGL